MPLRCWRKALPSSGGQEPLLPLPDSDRTRRESWRLFEGGGMIAKGLAAIPKGNADATE